MLLAPVGLAGKPFAGPVGVEVEGAEGADEEEEEEAVTVEAGSG